MKSGGGRYISFRYLVTPCPVNKRLLPSLQEYVVIKNNTVVNVCPNYTTASGDYKAEEGRG